MNIIYICNYMYMYRLCTSPYLLSGTTSDNDIFFGNFN